MTIRKKSRGRPRHNHPKIDQGTKELQQKRNILLGVGPGQDTALAESLLGILYGRQLISESLYEAGRFFGELGYRYEPCLGHKFRHNSSILAYRGLDKYGCNPLSWSDAQVEKRTHAWHKALAALKQAGNDPYKIVLDVVLYERVIYRPPFPHSIEASLVLLRKGLRSLELYFKGVLQGEPGKRCDRESSARSTTFQQPLKGLQLYSLP